MRKEKENFRVELIKVLLNMYAFFLFYLGNSKSMFTELLEIGKSCVYLMIDLKGAVNKSKNIHFPSHFLS